MNSIENLALNLIVKVRKCPDDIVVGRAEGAIHEAVTIDAQIFVKIKLRE